MVTSKEAWAEVQAMKENDRRMFLCIYIFIFLSSPLEYCILYLGFDQFHASQVICVTTGYPVWST